MTATATALPTIAPYPLPTRAQLPPQRVDWRPDPARAVLLVHDLQRYFLRPFPHGVEPVTSMLAHVVALRARCRAAGVPVVYTAQPGTQHDRGLLTDFWGEGIRAVVDAEPELEHIVSELTPAPGETVLTKWRYSAFQRTPLAGKLAAAGRDQLLITGIYAHIGCLATALEAFMLDVQAFLVADAVADFSRERHDQALEYASSRCARVLTTSDTVAALTGGAA